MAVKKIIKQIAFQNRLIEIFNKGTDDETTIELVPNDRVVVKYVEGEETDLIVDGALIETPDIDEPSILIEKQKMSSGNPNSYDLSTVGSQELLTALLEKDYETFEIILQNVCLKTLSYHDTANDQEKMEAPEQVYHAFLLGVFINLNNEYIIDSNKESGTGRFDIILEPRDISKTAFIIELKRVTLKQTIEQAINEALNQIEKKKYDVSLIDKGFKNIEKVAMAFDGKDALVSNKIIEKG